MNSLEPQGGRLRASVQNHDRSTPGSIPIVIDLLRLEGTACACIRPEVRTGPRPRGGFGGAPTSPDYSCGLFAPTAHSLARPARGCDQLSETVGALSLSRVNAR